MLYLDLVRLNIAFIKTRKVQFVGALGQRNTPYGWRFRSGGMRYTIPPYATRWLKVNNQPIYLLSQLA